MTSSSASTASTSRRWSSTRPWRACRARAAARSRWSSTAAAASCRSASSRAKYEVKAVEGKLLEDGVGYIKIRIFASNTDAALGELLDQLNAKAKGLKGLVLDMRRNPGGLLDQGIRVADRFIADGLIVKTVGKGGHVMDEAKAYSRGTWSGFPMVVVVDGATASAAEIVAGALQDHGRAVVLGTQTFGKGSVQTVIDLDGCGGKPCGLKLTVARYYTPKGRSIQGQGITPNVVVDATPPPADAIDPDSPRERDLRKRLRNEQGEKATAAQAAGRLPAADGARLPAVVVGVLAAGGQEVVASELNCSARACFCSRIRVFSATAQARA